MNQSDTSRQKDAGAAVTEGVAAGASATGRDSASFMKGVVIFLGVLLILGFVVIFSTIIYRSVKLAEGKSTGTSKSGFASFDVPVTGDGTVTGIDVDGNRMAIHRRDADGDEILVIDIRRGHLLGRVRLKPQ